MFFKAVTFYQFLPGLLPFDLEAHLQAARLAPIAPSQLSNRGFVQPLGEDTTAWTHGCGSHTWITLGGNDRILPPAVIATELSKRVRVAEAEQGRSLGGRARRRMHEQVVAELLPRAFVRPYRLDASLDNRAGVLMVNTTSPKHAEALISNLRAAVGSFPCLPLDPEAAVRSLLTGWVAGNALPAPLALGDECVLGDDEGTVRVSHMELQTEEVQNHLEAGMQVTQLGLVMGDTLGFTLDENLVVRKLKFLDGVDDALEAMEPDSLAAEFAARYALMTGELSELFSLLKRAFRIPNIFEELV